ncbi:arginine--tRNA ligase [Halobacillus halophilus]|uniref:arginine--tRNA ligase n=1 Tax=Halobacillus halophilus TaxID=1570 RepID=UPI00136B6E80|nr:arginine--tRNA ligase [Halobacillus halophilus]MYL30192.1 arginine--tRNA ligase [Halobacillus halophilus]
MEKQITALQISHILGEDYPRGWVESLIEIPKKEEFGDAAFPCFALAKSMRKSPAVIAGEIAARLKHPVFDSIEVQSGYINIFFDRAFITEHTLNQVLEDPGAYGSHTFGEGKNAVFDMSSPNIAKPFSMGHLRSTVIGNALANLVEKCGYQAVKVNYIGDYGTQFGKLLAAYTRWGDPKVVEEDPIKELTKLYVTFHEEAEEEPSLVEEGREWFKKLEAQDPEALLLWNWFREASLQEFDTLYEMLGVDFDLTRGEAYYTDKMEPVIQQLEDKGLLEKSEGADVVQLDESMPPCLIRKSNGTTTYATRDLAAAIDRYQSYPFEKSLYVVGNEQTLHFNQIKQVLKKAGFEWADRMEHVSFGMILQDGQKMSTRKGKTVLLEEVLEEAVDQALMNIKEKNPDLMNPEETARQVGVGAVIFHDLKQDRRHDIEFSLEDMLTFEGNTGPYLQYTHARACSLLRKGGFSPEDSKTTGGDPESWSLVKTIRAFPEVTASACSTNDPSKAARYLLDLGRSFNQYYAKSKIIGSHTQQENLTLVYAFTVVMKEGLRLLGMAAPEHM